MDARWLERFPLLSPMDEPDRRFLAEHARIVDLPRDSLAFHEGSPCESFLLLLEGCVRVEVTAASGREVVLYRVEPGGTCVLTTAALIAGDSYAARGVAETDVKAVALPATRFHELLGRVAPFRAFVFSTFARRLSGLLALLEEVAFERLDVRLARFLLARGGGETELKLTHQQIASELGSSREVVSRQLKAFERRGWVSLGRGRVRVARTEALRERLARPSP
jgi:CRP/FNR family transcriptional regulator